MGYKLPGVVIVQADTFMSGLMGVLFFWPLDFPFVLSFTKHLLLDSNYIENHLSYCNELASEGGSWLPFKDTSENNNYTEHPA